MNNVPLVAKMSIQDKIAELESRIAALEQKYGTKTVTTTKTTIRHSDVDLEPEMSGIWKSVDALFKKAFR